MRGAPPLLILSSLSSSAFHPPEPLPFMLSLRDQLLCAEDDFLTALAQEGDALSAFDERWRRLLDDVDSAINASAIDPQTATLAYTVATRCALLADTSASLFATYDTLTSQLVDQLDTMMSELSITERPCCPPVSPTVAEEIDRARSSSTKRRRRFSGQDTPTKRRRVSSSSLDSASELSSDSTCSSVSRGVFTTQYNLSAHRTNKRRASSPCPSPLSIPAPSRKRRLSEDDLSNLPPRAKRPYSGPRLHAVSDSFTTILPLHSSIPPLLLALEPSPLPPDATMPLEIQPFHPPSSTETCLMDHLSHVDHLGDVDAHIDPVSALDPMGLDSFLTSLLDAQISSREQTPFSAYVQRFGDSSSSWDSIDSPRSTDSDCSPAVTPAPITPPANGHLDLPSSLVDPGSFFDSIHHGDAFVSAPSGCQPDWLSFLPSPLDDMGDIRIPPPSCAMTLSACTRFLELKSRGYEPSLSSTITDSSNICALPSNSPCPTALTIT